jgi:hypothetical protein
MSRGTMNRVREILYATLEASARCRRERVAMRHLSLGITITPLLRAF